MHIVRGTFIFDNLLSKLDLTKVGDKNWDFKDKNISKVFQMLDEGKKEVEVYNYLEVAFAKFFHELSIKEDEE